MSGPSERPPGRASRPAAGSVPAPQPAAPLAGAQATLFAEKAPPRPNIQRADGATVVRTTTSSTRAEPLSVTELTERIARQLSVSFSLVAVIGEVSQPRVHNGHLYFTLRDEGARVDAMVWADRRALLRFSPVEGMRVVAMGAVRVFEKRGAYSLHVDRIELVGEGELQRVLEALKTKLRAEGLFDEARKRPLPEWVRTVGLVTSLTGAVRRDIETTLQRGDARVSLVIAPARVSGEGAGADIARALGSLIARRNLKLDVIVIARGGGSAEELWAFNEEGLARAIVASPVPVISAVGHETDVSVADLVADLRAATPTAAAARIVDINRRARERFTLAAEALQKVMARRAAALRARLAAVSAHRVLERERGRIAQLRWRTGAALGRAERGARRLHDLRRRDVQALAARHARRSPDAVLLGWRAALQAAVARAIELMSRRMSERSLHLAARVHSLDALSPLAVLSRGYALATGDDGRIVRNARTLAKGDAVRVRLAAGGFRATVSETEP